MDASNLTEYLDYGDYYSNDGETFGVCDNTHLRAFGQRFHPTVYSIVAILGIVGNSGLLFIFLKYRDVRKIPPLCMVISDLLFATTLPLFAVYSYCSQWIFGHSTCKIATCVYTVTMFSSNFSLAYMSLEKYCSMVGSSRMVKTSGKRIAASVVWMLSFLASIPHVYFVEAQEHDGHQICTYHHVSTWRTAMKLEENIVGFIVPLTIMSVCSGHITYYRIKKIQQGQQQINRGWMTWQEMSFVVMFFILWFPYNVVIFLHALSEFHILSNCAIHQNLHLAVILIEPLAYTHVFVNPLVYASQTKRVWNLFRIARTDTAEFLIESSSEYQNGMELTAVHATSSSS